MNTYINYGTLDQQESSNGSRAVSKATTTPLGTGLVLLAALLPNTNIQMLFRHRFEAGKQDRDVTTSRQGQTTFLFSVQDQSVHQYTSSSL